MRQLSSTSLRDTPIDSGPRMVSTAEPLVANPPGAVVRQANPPTARCAVLVERIGPYHFARLDSLGKRLSTVAIEICEMDATYAWSKIVQGGSFSRLTLCPTNGRSPEERRRIADRVRSALHELAPTVVFIPGWSDVASLAALSWCVRTATPAVVLSASSLVGRTRAGWKEFIKRQVVKLFSAGVGGGTPQREYLTRLGLAPERTFRGC